MRFARTRVDVGLIGAFAVRARCTKAALGVTRSGARSVREGRRIVAFCGDGGVVEQVVACVLVVCFVDCRSGRTVVD